MIKKLFLDNYLNLKDLIFDNYQILNIDEKELIIIYHLLDAIKKNKKLIKADSIAKRTNYQVNEVEDVLASLISKGFIEFKVELKSSKASEVFSLDPLFNTLERLIESPTSTKNLDEQNDLAQLITYFETTKNKSLSPLDIDLIKGINDEGYTIYDIKSISGNERMTIREISNRLTLNLIEKESSSPKSKKIQNLEDFYNKIK